MNEVKALPHTRLSDDVIVSGSLYKQEDQLRLSYALDGEQFDVEVRVAPKDFQFRTKIDPRGLDGRLKDMPTWHAFLAGTLEFFEPQDESGILYVADGHQRSGAADDLLSAGVHDEIPVQFFLLKEAEGWTRPLARIRGAVKNIAQGSADIIDVAKAIRNGASEELFSGYVPKGQRFFKEGRQLSYLSDDVFNHYLNDDKLPVEYGLALARYLPLKNGMSAQEVDEISQKKMVMLQFLRRISAPPRAADFLVEEAQKDALAKLIHDGQGSLFGDESYDVAQQDFYIRYLIRGRALDLLKKQKQFFQGGAAQCASSCRDV